MKLENENRIFRGILKGGLIHTFGTLIIWILCIREDTMHPMMALNWYVIFPILINNISLLVCVAMDKLRMRGALRESVYDQIIAFLFASICCANYIILRKFDLSFLVMVLPVVMLLLEHRNVRNVSHVIILIVYYELTQFLPDLLPGEPAVYLRPRSEKIFGAYISASIMLLLWATKDAYAYSFKKKEESELKLNTYSNFLLKKNKDVRGAVHNVKGTAEMILRNNVSSAGAERVMEIMEACNRIVGKVDMILEASRAELFRKDTAVRLLRKEEDENIENDGTYLYAPGAYVLVADDSAQALNLARALLARTGMKIDTAINGAEALKKISYNYYNLIVLDSVLPDMSAIQLMQEIRIGNNANTDTPVIVCTTGNRDEVRDMYLNEGFAEVVRKPLSGEQLERLAERYLPARLVSRRMS